ncbi:MAG: 4-hydroxy-tetrahydrodipicolinate synthase [Gammaproteobacteria bacterium]|nr:MAG: 4-hydroxy-tetrahydrodipicolinate synthase [Gammaproteobacteria bacterium]
MINIRGSMVAIVTPMLDDGQIDYQSLDSLIEFHIKNSTDAIVAIGSTGESATLSFLEHNSLIKYFIKKVAGRIPVIAGTGANSTTEAYELTKNAYESGVDACLLVVPYYNKPTQEGIYLHYKTIAEKVDVPIILYNVPGRTAVDMETKTAARLSQIKNIVAIKEATGDINRIKDILKICSDDFVIYSGDDGSAADAILSGAVGNISVTANIVPALMSRMCKSALIGDNKQTKILNDSMINLHKNLFTQSNPIPVKWALHKMGMIDNGIRLPLTPLSTHLHQPLLDAMTEAGVIL